MGKTYNFKQINHPQQIPNKYNINNIFIIEYKLKQIIKENIDKYDLSVIKNFKEYKYMNEQLKQHKRAIYQCEL